MGDVRTLERGDRGLKVNEGDERERCWDDGPRQERGKADWVSLAVVQVTLDKDMDRPLWRREASKVEQSVSPGDEPQESDDERDETDFMIIHSRSKYLDTS